MRIFLLAVFFSLLGSVAVCQEDAQVKRCAFTSGIEGREPVDLLSSYSLENSPRIYLFTELVNMDGADIYHVWYRNGEKIFEKNFPVGNSRWRVYSSMDKAHFEPLDNITVQVVGDDGTRYARTTIQVTE